MKFSTYWWDDDVGFEELQPRKDPPSTNKQKKQNPLLPKNVYGDRYICIQKLENKRVFFSFFFLLFSSTPKGRWRRRRDFLWRALSFYEKKERENPFIAFLSPGKKKKKKKRVSWYSIRIGFCLPFFSRLEKIKIKRKRFCYRMWKPNLAKISHWGKRNRKLKASFFFAKLL